MRPASDATAATGCALPVGLFGEQTKTTSGLASTTADTLSSESAKPSSRVSDTISVCVSQAMREWSRYVGSSTAARRPTPPYACRSCVRISFEPFAAHVPSTGWPTDAESSSRRRVIWPSG